MLSKKREFQYDLFVHLSHINREQEELKMSWLNFIFFSKEACMFMCNLNQYSAMLIERNLCEKNVLHVQNVHCKVGKIKIIPCIFFRKHLIWKSSQLSELSFKWT
jgi:hypothetical protein